VKALLIALLLCAMATAHADERQSSYAVMKPETRALQDDDTQNPAMLWVEEGRALWDKNAPNGKSCADCHNDARQSMRAMRGVAARYPAYSSSLKRALNLQQQINLCRTTKQKASALPIEHQTLLALESFIALQSRGLPIAPPTDKRLRATKQRGEKLFNQRIGQIDLSCKDCHVNNAGKALAGNIIPEAHPTAYPIYRLEWQAVGSLQRRLRNCMVGVRAEPYALGSDEMVALEVYLAARAAGMKVESPGVRP
jgi:L-cysteine S-thiosulfotransferase